MGNGLRKPHQAFVVAQGRNVAPERSRGSLRIRSVWVAGIESPPRNPGVPKLRGE